MMTTKGFIGSCFAWKREPIEVATLVGLDGDNYVHQINKTNLSLRLFCDTSFNGNTCALDVAEVNGINVVFCGEAYNCDELCKELDIDEGRRSTIPSSHVAGLLYRKYGIEFAKKINGMFSIFIWDEKDNTCYLYADRFGNAFPVYYHCRSGCLTFASRLRLLLQHGNIMREIDKTGLSLFLKYSYIPAPATIIKNVNKLGPGEVLKFKNNSCRVFRYYAFEVNNVHEYNEDEAAEKYIEILGNSIKDKVFDCDPQKTGFFLSGGLDSSANVALAALKGMGNFKTFGIGFKDPALDERPYSRLVAKHFNLEFFEHVFDGSAIKDLPKIVWHLDEPFMENGLFLTYAGFKAAKDKVDIIIAGDGADQLFGTGGFAEGRPIALRYLFDRLHCKNFISDLRNLLFPLPYKDNLLFKSKVMIDRAVDFNDWFFWGFDEKELEKLCKFPIDRKKINCFSNVIKNTANSFEDYYNYSLSSQDIEHYVCQNIIVKSYRMSELFGINIREAYLDNNVIDFLLSLRMNLKTKGSSYDFLRGRRITKYLHRAAMKDILPFEILNKPKQGGFIPMGMLLADKMQRKKIFDYLLNSKALQNFFHMEYINKLVHECENAMLKNPYWTAFQDNKVNQVMNLIVFSIWHKVVFEAGDTVPPDADLYDFI